VEGVDLSMGYLLDAYDAYGGVPVRFMNALCRTPYTRNRALPLWPLLAGEAGYTWCAMRPFRALVVWPASTCMLVECTRYHARLGQRDVAGVAAARIPNRAVFCYLRGTKIAGQHRALEHGHHQRM
jgi:hypothetical protein